MISSIWRHPCQLDLSQHYRATHPQSPLTIGISFPDDNVTRSGRIGFILGVWLPLVKIEHCLQCSRTICMYGDWNTAALNDHLINTSHNKWFQLSKMWNRGRHITRSATYSTCRRFCCLTVTITLILPSIYEQEQEPQTNSRHAVPCVASNLGPLSLQLKKKQTRKAGKT